MNKDHDVKVLNNLIKTTRDSQKGFADAAEDSETQLSQWFGRMAQDRAEVVSQLQAQVTSLGGDPEDDGSFAASAHQSFMDLKQAVMGQGEEQIIKEVERGEDHIKDKYESALQDRDLSPESRRVVEQAYQSVREGHDAASAMKHQMEG